MTHTGSAARPCVLVTGGAGYIGSHLVARLGAAGYSVVTFDNLVYGHRAAVLYGEFVQGDLAQPHDLDAVFTRFPIQAVLHFAAYAYVGESVTDPARYYENNVACTLNLLAAMRRHHVGQLIFSSTCATFGEPVRTPIDEQHPQRPINPYGRTKWMIEQILADYQQAYGLRSIVLRYFNAAGADPRGRIGEQHDPETHLIPLVLQAIQGRRDNLTVFGRDYDTPDGTCIRDYIHVDDLAQAHQLALEQLLQGAPSRAYNLGNGLGYSVQQVIETAQQVTGLTVPVHYGPRRPGDPARLVGDSLRARQELHWQPRYGDLPTILQHAWAWEQRCANGNPWSSGTGITRN